jgi:hypothetical protein
VAFTSNYSALVMALVAGLSAGGCGGVVGDGQTQQHGDASGSGSDGGAFDASAPTTGSDSDALARDEAMSIQAGPITVASGLDYPNSLAVGPTGVYWTNRGKGLGPAVVATASTGSVMRCAIGGCAGPTVLATGQDNPIAIALDPANVYWTNFGSAFDASSVAKCPIAGCVQLTVLTSLSCAEGLAVDSTNAFFIGCTQPAAMRCSLAGCAAPATLAVFQTADFMGDSAIAVQSGRVYWTERFGAGGSAGAVLSCAANGCAAPTAVVSMAAGNVEQGLALDSANLYFAIQYRARDSGPTVWKCSIGGCAAATAVSADMSPANGPIAVDSANVYWTTLDPNTGMGSVMQCSKSGCSAPTVLASADHPSAIAVDSHSVYWTNVGHGATLDGAGSVMKVAK